MALCLQLWPLIEGSSVPVVCVVQGQIGTDIHLTDWRQNPALPRIRQLAMALGLPAQTIGFITPEIYAGMAPGPRWWSSGTLDSTPRLSRRL